MWIGWKHQLYNLVVLLTTEQLIDVRISDKADKMSLYVTVVYGLHTIEDRKPLWSTISQLNITTHPWIVLGDFNSLLSTDVQNQLQSDLQNQDLHVAEKQAIIDLRKWVQVEESVMLQNKSPGYNG